MITVTNVLVIFWNFWFIIDVLHFDFPSTSFNFTFVKHWCSAFWWGWINVM